MSDFDKLVDWEQHTAPTPRVSLSPAHTSTESAADVTQEGEGTNSTEDASPVTEPRGKKRKATGKTGGHRASKKSKKSEDTETAQTRQTTRVKKVKSAERVENSGT